MHTGTIASVKLDRGYGFISLSGQPDVFFNFSDLADDLPDDNTLRERRVRFEIQDSPKGLRAVNVRPVE